jgi:hypothetical protein
VVVVVGSHGLEAGGCTKGVSVQFLAFVWFTHVNENSVSTLWLCAFLHVRCTPLKILIKIKGCSEWPHYPKHKPSTTQLLIHVLLVHWGPGSFCFSLCISNNPTPKYKTQDVVPPIILGGSFPSLGDIFSHPWASWPSPQSQGGLCRSLELSDCELPLLLHMSPVICSCPGVPVFVSSISVFSAQGLTALPGSLPRTAAWTLFRQHTWGNHNKGAHLFCFTLSWSLMTNVPKPLVHRFLSV